MLTPLMGHKGAGGGGGVQNVPLKIQIPLILNVLDHKEGRDTILSYARRPFVCDDILEFFVTFYTCKKKKKKNIKFIWGFIYLDFDFDKGA